MHRAYFIRFKIEMLSGDANADSLFNEFIKFIKFIINLFAHCATVPTVL